MDNRKSRPTRATFKMWPGVLAGVLLTGVLASCSSSVNSSSDSSSVIRIGLLASLSGAYATLGPVTEAGAQVAVDDLNAGKGIVVNGKHYTVELDVKNDQSNPQVALSQEEQLVRDDKVIAVIGPLADAAVTVAPVAAQQKVINITASTGAKALLGKPGYPLLFSTAPSTNYQAAAVVKGIGHWFPSTKRIAIVTNNNAATQKLNPLIVQYAKDEGMTTSEYIFPLGTTDISALATKVVAFKPDVVFTAPDDPTVLNVIKQLDAAGISRSVPVFNLGGDETVVQSAEGHPVITQNIAETDLSGADTTPAVVQFVAAVKAKLTSKVNPALSNADLYYPSIVALGKAIVAAGTVSDTAAIAKAMATLQPVSVLGANVRWSTDHTFPFPILSILSESDPTSRQTTHIEGLIG